MDERAALAAIADLVPEAGDDAATVEGISVSTDMLHEATDFPEGTTRYTAGWRAVGASLSDLAAVGATPVCAVAAYGAPDFDEVTAFVTGARDVCEAVGTRYVGGDLDGHEEVTVATTAVGRTDDPVGRDGARPGDRVVVTGTLGRTGAALRLFADGHIEWADDLFRFPPRVAAGRELAAVASAMQDSSDGLARTVHTIAERSDCGIEIDGDAVPVDPAVEEVATDDRDRADLSRHVGEDFELVATVPNDAVARMQAALETRLTVIGRIVATSGVRVDGEELPDRGYGH
ncbi:thiamine-phosphate kinase [Halobacteriales archaeon SW_7_68_16]|nr:MAG: thiamine-phosphate kinase [Halobacteriales archaeon SW_7_68_16]